MKVVGIKQGKKTHGFSPYWPKLDKFPTSLSLWNHAPFDLVAVIVAGQVDLIMDAYLHDDKLKMYAACPIYTRWQI